MTNIRHYILFSLAALLFNSFFPLRTAAQTVSDSISEMDGYIKALERDPYDIEALSTVYKRLTSSGDFRAAAEYASLWLDKWGGDARDDILLLTYANLGQWNMASDNVEEAKYYLAQSMSLLDKLSENWDDPYYRIAFYIVYNCYGVYYVNVEMDYHKAVSYFLMGFEAAEKYGDREQYTTLGCNLVVTYYLRNDPAGLPYALRIYEYGDAVGDRYIKFCGSHVTATMYYVLGDYVTALKYMEEALELMDKFYDEAGLYTTYADILLKNGMPDKAQTYYLKAVDLADRGIASSTSGTSAYLSYGEYLLGKKQYSQAIGILRKGVEMSKDKKNTVFRYKLYQNLSSAYRSIGEMDKAMDYYIMFHEESDSIFNVERERSINELRVKYEAEKKEKEIEQGKLQLVQQNRKLQAIAFVLIIIAILAGAIFILYRHKNRLYIQLLKQHQETLANERKLERKIEQMESEHEPENPPAEKAVMSGGPTDKKHDEIYERLEELMTESHSYREKDLTVEKVAKMISTNRTYLSRAINEKTGLSFNYYINSYRIEEAVRVLSDPDNDIPLKTLSYELGFHSLSTFYKLFNSVIGMPPSKFREKAMAERDAA